MHKLLHLLTVFAALFLLAGCQPADDDDDDTGSVTSSSSGNVANTSSSTAHSGTATSTATSTTATSRPPSSTTSHASSGSAATSGVAATDTILDHRTVDVRQIPAQWITAAKNQFHILYAHTSHGSQVVSGMEALQSYAPFGSTYQFTENGSAGLDFNHGMGDYGSTCPDISNCNETMVNGEPAWVPFTRERLTNDPTVNVVMWAWCSISGHEMDNYLEGMEKLISEYGPGGTNPRAQTTPVTFIFMTGHSDSTSAPRTNAVTIRAHCEQNHRWLIDYYDIESHDLAGNSYADQGIADNLDYNGGNWAEEYMASPDADPVLKALTGLTPSCAHSDGTEAQKLNCVLKGQAFWWALARMAGWDGR